MKFSPYPLWSCFIGSHCVSHKFSPTLCPLLTSLATQEYLLFLRGFRTSQTCLWLLLLLSLISECFSLKSSLPADQRCLSRPLDIEVQHPYLPHPVLFTLEFSIQVQPHLACLPYPPLLDTKLYAGRNFILFTAVLQFVEQCLTPSRQPTKI